MLEIKNIKKTRGVTLKTPNDLQRITAQDISDIFQAGQHSNLWSDAHPTELFR
jgi:hypothetical protein